MNLALITSVLTSIIVVIITGVRSNFFKETLFSATKKRKKGGTNCIFDSSDGDGDLFLIKAAIFFFTFLARNKMEAETGHSVHH